MLGKYKARLPPVVIHCFTGDATQAAAYLKEGCYIGLTGGRLSLLSSTEMLNCRIVMFYFPMYVYFSFFLLDYLFSYICFCRLCMERQI